MSVFNCVRRPMWNIYHCNISIMNHLYHHAYSAIFCDPYLAIILIKSLFRLTVNEWKNGEAIYYKRSLIVCFLIVTNMFWSIRCQMIRTGFLSMAEHGRGQWEKTLSHMAIPPCSTINALRPNQNGRNFADDIWSAFSLMKMIEFRIRFHLSLFLRVQLTIT